MNCPICHFPVPASARFCPACGEDVGFPNIRAVSTVEERDALARRLSDARVSAKARGCDLVLEQFGAEVATSKAVIARSLGVIENLLESSHTVFTSFHQQVSEGARIPEDNIYDNGRAAVDAWLFPHYHAQIKFGCLSLGSGGLSGYGSYHLVLKDALIERRATVFEENSFRFMERHRLPVTTPIPPGYRTTWAQRGLLAMAKLHGELTPSTQSQQFPALLLRDDGTTGTSDFIEVHIYGPFTRDTVEKVMGPRPQTREDRVIWARLERHLPNHGIAVEAV